MLKIAKRVFIISLVLFLIAGVFVGVKALNNDDTYIDFKGVTISKQDYLSIKENFKDYKQIKICNIETNDCISLIKLGVDNMEDKFQGPVPEGYDEEYFRETGKTQPIKKESE